MGEFLVIVCAAVMVVVAWVTYAWSRKIVQRSHNAVSKQMLRAMLALCWYVTIIPGLTFGGGNYWLATMATIPFTIVMAVWLGYIARTATKRRASAMTQDVPNVAPEGVKIRTAPRVAPVTVEPYSAGGGTRSQTGRGPRASRIMREVEA